MARESSRSIVVNPNIRCMRVYPTESTKKDIKELKTIGIRLNKEQALHLARVLIAACQDWKEIDLTAYRFEKRKADGSYHVTITHLSN